MYNVPMTKNMRKVLAALSTEPKHFDNIITESMLSSYEAAAALCRLELCGKASQMAGKRFVSKRDVPCGQ